MSALNPSSSILYPPASMPSSSRIEALDWVKGALVVFMVIYHGINYSAFRPFAFQYLSFVPPSFILIAGFLVGQVYATKYDLKSWKPYLRLAFRGFKLLVLFTILNVINCILLERSFYFGLWLFADRAYTIFISGNGRVGVFEVLLPIAYFLLLAPALLWFRARVPLLIPLFAASVFLLCFILERRGANLDNLILLSYGFIGIAMGLISMAKVNRFAARFVPVLAAYVAYRLASHFNGETYAVQVLASITTLSLLYCCGANLRMDNWSWRHMILLGNYSLFGYLAQIVLLRVIVKLFGGLPQTWGIVCAVILITTVSLYITIRLVDSLRRKARPLDIAYKTIFA